MLCGKIASAVIAYIIHYVYTLHQHDVLVFRSMWIRISTISTQPCQKEEYFYPPIY